MPYSSTFPILLKGFHLFPLHSPITTFIFQAPHGKHADPSSRLNLNGKLGWFSMEIVSPLMLLYSVGDVNRLNGSTRLLVTLWLAHYMNRAIVQVLLSKGMAPMHVLPWLSAAAFNYVNGTIVGQYLSTNPSSSISNPVFIFGAALWVAGWIGNVYHDNILLQLRQRTPSPKDPNSITISSSKRKDKTRTYSIPWGGLFSQISFPNYFCELLEWTGFAIACSSPIILAALTSTSLANTFQQPSLASSFFLQGYTATMGGTSIPLLTPAWLFVLNEIATLVPRALTGHWWYQEKFPNYPKRRKAILPRLL